MTQVLSKKQKCVQVRSGLEIWIDKEKAEKFQDLLKNITQHKYVKLEGDTFNTADIVGIFEPDHIERRDKIKRGDWQCEFGHWHIRGQQCGHGMLPR